MDEARKADEPAPAEEPREDLAVDDHASHVLIGTVVHDRRQGLLVGLFASGRRARLIDERFRREAGIPHPCHGVRDEGFQFPVCLLVIKVRHGGLLGAAPSVYASKR